MPLIRKYNLTESVLNDKVKNYLLTEANWASGYSPNNNYASNLPETYSGSPNRTERYNQYFAMELDDQISGALDILSEFSTQTDEKTGLPFDLHFNDSPSTTESEILNKMLISWCRLQKWDARLFDTVRDILKLGDAFFIRDPETYQLLWVYQGNVEKVIVNESKGKKPEQYMIRDLDFNLQGLAASMLPNTYSGMLPSVPGATLNVTNYNTRLAQQGSSPSRFNNSNSTTAIDAEHIVHINMNHGQDANWPFGSSILEAVFKSYKQKELIEDSILIYRIQRAPMRRVFNIDVGDIPEQKAMAYMEQMKNAVNQRRIPSKTMNNQNIMDASYNPLSILDDYWFLKRPDGRGSSVEMLQGGDTAWGIAELLYFNNKLARGLRIPSSYLPTSPDESTTTYNDGKVGAALIQEYRFAKRCGRIQNSIIGKFDEEFKLYLKMREVNIDSSLFSLKFIEPQSFSQWREIELNSSRLNNFNQVQGLPYISKRFAMMQYLGLSEDEINRNNEMLIEENPSKFKDVNAVDSMINKEPVVDLRSVGISKADAFNADGEPIEEPVPGEEEMGNEPNAAQGNDEAGAAGPAPQPGPGPNGPQQQ